MGDAFKNVADYRDCIGEYRKLLEAKLALDQIIFCEVRSQVDAALKKVSE